MFLFVFSLSVSAIHLSFKENDSVVLEKELVQCAVFENTGLERESSHFMCLFLLLVCVSPGCF